MNSRGRQDRLEKGASGRGSRGSARRGHHDPPSEPVRLNRYIANAGVCSRRKADDLIESGVVRVNGEITTDFSTRVTTTDVVSVRGRRISPASYQYILLNKPSDTITTTSDERGRSTVLDVLGLSEDDVRGLFPVGRLDRNTTGVLLLTNDGELANRLMHPRYKIDKFYVAILDRPASREDLSRLTDGVELSDGPAKADFAALPDPANPKQVGISVHEGRNRQIRRMIEHLGYQVKKLERVNYAGLTTKGIRRGKWRRLKDHEIRRLYRAVRLKTN